MRTFSHLLVTSPPLIRLVVQTKANNEEFEGINRSEEAFFQSYDDTQDYERPMRVRFSPFSEYDSSSSEYDRGSTPALSDYSPQFTSRSRANSTRSSPTPGFSPELGPGSASAPTSNPSYSHLVATFAAPKRRKSRRKLGPDERREVHQLRKMGACTRCWGLKMKCGEGNPCPRCEKLGAGALCVRVHFVDLDVFSKCKLLTWPYNHMYLSNNSVFRAC